jgi:hypothetical protein
MDRKWPADYLFNIVYAACCRMAVCTAIGPWARYWPLTTFLAAKAFVVVPMSVAHSLKSRRLVWLPDSNITFVVVGRPFETHGPVKSCRATA